MIRFVLSEVSTDFTLADVSPSGGLLSNFAGSGSNYTATFTADAATAGTASISVGSGRYSDAAGNFNVDGHESDNRVLIEVDAVPPSQAHHVLGKVYHWKSHALLNDVQIKLGSHAVAPVGGALFDLRAVSILESGEIRADLWANLTGAAENIGLEIALAGAPTVNFAFDTGTLNGWSTDANAIVNNQSGTTSLVLAAFTAVGALSGAVRLGQISITPQGVDAWQQIDFSFGEAGNQSLVPYATRLGSASGETGPDGGYRIANLPLGAYTLSAERAIGSTESGNVISSADALAALKIAVGRNPNPDPDSGGPMSPPAVSPYQFIAADVNVDGKVTSSDALAILKMAVRRTDAMPREWVFVDEKADFWDESLEGGAGGFSTTRTNVQWDRALTVQPDRLSGETNLVGLLKGDVNGNWSAPVDSTFLSDDYFHGLVAAHPFSMHLSQFGVSPASDWAPGLK